VRLPHSPPGNAVTTSGGPMRKIPTQLGPGANFASYAAELTD